MDVLLSLQARYIYNNNTAPSTVLLGYSAEEPFAVSLSVSLGECQETWVFARELLKNGVHMQSGQGDVIVRPGHGGVVYVTIIGRVDTGQLVSATVELKRNDVKMFLQRTTLVVPFGEEKADFDISAL